EGYSAERDVSDYLLMSYCLEKDVPVLAICRGMQMLSVVSGADIIQDIPTYMSGLGKG
ncbi:MAG: gamma-glutamyl-gamma-aminobutyrate hydrolase family protein, partial [Selenomonas sp.]|nr:gamma-glutamyl-gamma-aminobutyrate hydrolase family protein [Selenomonas sp.]